MEKHINKSYTIMGLAFFPFSKKIPFLLESTAEKWMEEARASVHAYEAALQQINASQSKVSPACMTSLYGQYLKDTIESL